MYLFQSFSEFVKKEMKKSRENIDSMKTLSLISPKFYSVRCIYA